MRTSVKPGVRVTADTVRSIRNPIHVDSGVIRCSIAANGRKALEVFKQLRPNLITMDITMPELDGVGCIEAIIAIDPEVRILVISALADKAIAIEAIKRGATGFINKPINERKLIDALEELISD